MTTVVAAARGQKQEHRAGEDRSLGSCAATLGVYGVAVAGSDRLRLAYDWLHRHADGDGGR